MKVLVCCLEPPWPPMYGVQLRCWETVSLVREVAEVCVFAVSGNAPPPTGIPASAWHMAGAKVGQDRAAEWMKRENGFPTDGYYSETAAHQLRRLLETFSPGVAILETLQMHRYESELQGHGARVVLNAHNSEADLARQLARRERFAPLKLQRAVLADRLKRLEAGLCSRVAQIWVCSNEDRQLFLRDYDIRVPAHVVPNAAEPARYQSRQPCPTELEDAKGPKLLLAGGFDYPPNQRGAEFLIRELFPEIAREYPDARLVLAGSGPTAAMRGAAAADSRIIVTGEVPDIIPYFQHSSVLLVPLREGGGTRFKIIEAFAAKLPVVSTAKGTEGLGAEPGTHYLEAEDVPSFLDAIHRILNDRTFTNGMVHEASLMQQKNLWGEARTTIHDALAALQP